MEREDQKFAQVRNVAPSVGGVERTGGKPTAMGQVARNTVAVCSATRVTPRDLLS
jgi:hypothetical protein